ncbi:MAG: hypothetical protein QXU32_05255 [Nitrososphaerales archaeon]
MSRNATKLGKSMLVAVAISAVTAIIVLNIHIQSVEAKYTGVIREFYIFSVVNEDVEEMEEELEIPPDQFSQTQITVRKGDTVRIHFYNLAKRIAGTSHIHDS